MDATATSAGLPVGADALAADPTLLPALLDDAPVGFALFDPACRYLHANTRLAAANLLPPEDHLGRTVREVAPAIADAVEAHVHAVLGDGLARPDVPIDGHDGEGRPSHWSTSWYPVRDGTGALIGVAVLATEVTALVEDGERQRDAALTLQRSLLPAALPDAGGLELAVRYAAGGGQTQVGGDLYDVVPLGGGRLALVIGDVMGRGMRAAAVMGQLRTAVRTCARLDLRPAEVLEVLDALVADVAGDGEVAIATCAYAVFDPFLRELRLASAGHLPPVLRRADGTTAPVDVEVSPPLGVGDAPREARLRLEPGSVLALFTDGLVERRDRDLDDGIAALCRLLTTCEGDLEDMADEVVSALAAPDADDDVALLLARVPTDLDARSRTVVLPVPRERALLIDVRSRARAEMASWALLDEVADTATLLASELVTNALVHGRGDVELRLRLTRDRLLVEVEDAGEHLPRRRRATPEEEGGRGLHMVSTLADRWGTRHTDVGKLVWAELDLAH